MALLAVYLSHLSIRQVLDTAVGNLAYGDSGDRAVEGVKSAVARLLRLWVRIPPWAIDVYLL
jgi:hypothetical protein